MSGDLSSEAIITQESSSPEEARLKARLGEFLRQSVTCSAESPSRGYSLVVHGGRNCGLALNLGPVDLDEPKPRIDKLVGAAQPSPAPVAKGETYGNYLLAEFQGLWYAVPRALGPLNLAHPAERNLPEVLNSRQRESLKIAIDSASCPSATPRAALRRLAEDYAGFGLHALSGLFVANELSQGEVDLEQARLGKQGRILAARTIESLKQRIDWARAGPPALGNARVLLVAAETPQRSRELLERFHCQNAIVLATDVRQVPEGCTSLVGNPTAPELAAKLRAAQFELVIVDYGPSLGAVPWESLLAPYCRRLLGVFAEGEPRMYEGEDFSRLLYNVAYLRSMYKLVPPLAGLRVLEVGCSDGLPCDLVARERPSEVVGVDMLETVGLRYQNPRSTFRQHDAASLPFADHSFDVAYSIATLEHVSDPLTALREIKRVLRPGGYAYVQTAPLYYSPFGHHMFGYFDHYPWIHVRLSKTEIAEYAHAHGIADRIKADRGLSAEQYIDGMLSLKHINGKLPHEYGIQALAKVPNVEIVAYAPSYEGKHLLTEQVLGETKPARPEDLVTHGFELVFRAR